VALIVECLTDNRHRTAGDVRSSFAKGGGHLAAEGAVAWHFQRRGVIEVRPGPGENQVMEAAIEAGAEDVVGAGTEGFEVRTEPSDLHQVASALEARKLALGARRVAFVPRETVKVADPEKARQILRLLDLLDELEDVQHVHANFEIEDRLLEELAR
jgi:YebC/PmpR family DNA-binding regulatory protein